MIAPKYKLLVVDDETDVNVIYKLMLEDLIENEVFEYHYFESGDSCMEYLNSQDHLDTIFLILSDINMPEMDGFTLLDRIKKAYEELTVFMVSAYCDDSYVNRAKELGAEDYIVKPVDFQVLRKKLLDLLELAKKS